VRFRTIAVTFKPKLKTSSPPPVPLLGGAQLWRTLGFRTAAAFRQALHRKTLPVPVFSLPGRSGKFARRVDVDQWLAQIDALIAAGEHSLPPDGGARDREA
jgi:hypothetical protein